MVILFYVTNMSYLIKSQPDVFGRFFAVSQESETNYSVGWFLADSDTPVKGSTHSCLGAALRRFKGDAAYNRLAVTWSSLKVSVGELIVLQTESRMLAREQVQVFQTQADYDDYRRSHLTLYDACEDLEEVTAAFKLGDLELAWQIANSDSGDKALWDSDFGSHHTERVPNIICFTDLPTWVQQIIKESL